MLRYIGKFFITLDKIYRKVLDTCDTLDLSTLIGYGFWFIFGIWGIVESTRDGTPLILSILGMSLIVCILGAVSYFAVSILRVALMGLYVPIEIIASYFQRREERVTGPGRFIAAAGDGELWQAKYLHDYRARLKRNNDITRVIMTPDVKNAGRFLVVISV